MANPMAGFKVPAAPKPGEKVVPILDDEALPALIRDVEAGRDYASHRDAALLRLFACTGMRLAEPTELEVGHVNPRPPGGRRHRQGRQAAHGPVRHARRAGP